MLDPRYPAQRGNILASYLDKKNMQTRKPGSQIIFQQNTCQNGDASEVDLILFGRPLVSSTFGGDAFDFKVALMHISG